MNEFIFTYTVFKVCTIRTTNNINFSLTYLGSENMAFSLCFLLAFSTSSVVLGRLSSPTTELPAAPLPVLIFLTGPVGLELPPPTPTKVDLLVAMVTFVPSCPAIEPRMELPPPAPDTRGQLTITLWLLCIMTF